jgi:endonuclease/exonuclease/phosphatase family metal-dependent hydrolase
MWMPVPGPITRLLRTSLRDAASLGGERRATWPSAFPVLRLDRAYVDSGVRVLRCGVADRGEAKIASDHLPLWLDLETVPPRTTGERAAVAAAATGA